MKNISHIVSILLTLITMVSLPVWAETEQPNIIFILADDLGANTLSMNGNTFIETPHIDGLAKNGTSFSQGYANYPTCKPSRAAILSGQYGPRTSIYRVSNKHKGHEEKIRFNVPNSKDTLPDATKNIAETLQEQGYRTAILGKWHLGPKGHSAINQGFDLSVETVNSHIGTNTVPNIDLTKDTYIPDALTDKAIEFMTKANTDKKPFFLYLPYYLIHKPLEAKPEDIKYYQQKGAGKYNETTTVVAAMTKAIDDNVGRLVASLKALGISDNTLVVFTSDNGGYKSEGNMLNGKLNGSKGMVNEGGIRVPYIFNWPNKIPANKVINDPVIGIDFYPTFMAVANIEKDKEQILDGVNLLPLLTERSASLAKRDIFWFYPKWARFNKKRRSWGDIWRNVIRSGDYKLIEYLDTDKYELFDLANDPYEKHNLAKTYPEKTELLKTKLAQWKLSVDAPTPVENPNYIFR